MQEMNATPIAADDEFTADQGQFTTTITGNLGADNGFGSDADPDGTVLGWTGVGFNPVGDGESYIGAFFSSGVLGFLHLQQSGYVTFPVFSTQTLIVTAEGGRVILNTDGSFTYTAPAGFSGVDWFEYELVDVEFGTDIGRVNLTVVDTEAGNDRPTAIDDVFDGAEDLQIAGNVLADNGNGADFDSNGDALSVTGQTIFTLHGGKVVILANGDFVYTPAKNYTGADSFIYTVKDSFGTADTGTVTLNLAAVNDAPTANNDTYLGAHDHAITGNVLLNDSDAEGDTLAVAAAAITTAAGGRVTLLADGTFTYEPATGFVGIDSFSYTVDDGHGGSAAATVALNVYNTPPAAVTDWYTVKYDRTLTGNVLTNDSDADGDPLTVTAGVFATALGGSVTVNADGTFSYHAAEAFYGTDSFSYVVSDGFGGKATATAMINTPAPAGSIYGTADVDIITGTALADCIFAFDEDDIVYGRDGNDVLAGGLKDDTLSGDGGDDKLYGQADRDLLKGGIGNDYLSGGASSDDLYGNDGVDRLIGGAGADKLYGGAGNDRFIFDAATGTSADKVMDFRAGDKLTVNAGDYGLAAGALPDASYFASGAAANVGHGRFLYTAANRSLSWDADGNAATANVVIATFDKAVSLSFADFLVL